MYGSWIGDIAANCKTHTVRDAQAGLLPDDGHLTISGIMTAAIASAILKSRREQFEHEKNALPFREFVEQETRAFLGECEWRANPEEYVSPCGIAAVSLREAVYMARICAEAAGADPDSAMDAEAAAGAVFLARMARKKNEIPEYFEKNCFPGCSGISVKKAIDCFIETDCFEDAVRRAVCLDEECSGAAAAITGAIAWRYYCGQNWTGNPDANMQEIRNQAERFIPEKMRAIGEELRSVAAQRGGTYYRTGGFCTPIMNSEERTEYLQKEKEEIQKGLRKAYNNITLPTDDGGFTLVKKPEKKPEPQREVTAEKKETVPERTYVRMPAVDAVKYLESHENQYYVKETMTVRPRKGRPFIAVLLEEVTDKEQLNHQWENFTVRRIIQLMKESPELHDGGVVWWLKPVPGRIEFRVYLHTTSFWGPFPRYTVWEAMQLSADSGERDIGCKYVSYDTSLGHTRMRIQLDKVHYWFISIFFDSSTGKTLKYSLDYEGATDKHFEFQYEWPIRKCLYQDGDDEKYIDEILSRYIKEHSGWELQKKLEPFFTATIVS